MATIPHPVLDILLACACHTANLSFVDGSSAATPAAPTNCLPIFSHFIELSPTQPSHLPTG